MRSSPGKFPLPGGISPTGSVPRPRQAAPSEDGAEPAQDGAVDRVGEKGGLPGARVELAAEEAVPGDEGVEETLRADEEDAPPR